MPPQMDAQEVARLFKAHGPMVYRRAYRLMGNPADAEEMTQEVFIRVMRSTGGAYAGRGELVGWLYRICTNLCLNTLRNRKRRRELFEQHVAPPKHTESGDQPVDIMMLRWLLANAEPRLAQAAVYVYLDGLSYAEAAELIGCSKRTVGNLLERFKTWAEQQAAAQSPAGRTE